MTREADRKEAQKTEAGYIYQHSQKYGQGVITQTAIVNPEEAGLIRALVVIHNGTNAILGFLSRSERLPPALKAISSTDKVEIVKGTNGVCDFLHELSRQNDDRIGTIEKPIYLYSSSIDIGNPQQLAQLNGSERKGAEKPLLTKAPAQNKAIIDRLQELSKNDSSKLPALNVDLLTYAAMAMPPTTPETQR